MHQLTCNGVLEGIRICMRGFPNRMLYPDYKMRYSCLGQAEISSSSDNKTATYALMDKIEFDRERYRLGHTLVFFRAGALAKLEEARDDLVIKWVRFIQGEVLRRVRGNVDAAKRDQRELIKVAQRNFRKNVGLRDWGWFVIIQKTRAMIGQPNPEEELRQLEEKANVTYGEYKAALDKTAELEGSMDDLKAEIAAMTKQLAEEQGSISVYTDRQAKANQLKAETDVELAAQTNVLKAEEASRIELAQEVKAHSGSIGAVKKDIEDVELMITKVETEKGNRDHTIRTLQDEIAEQDEVINKLNKELQARVEGAEEELEAERQARSKAERQRSDLAREIEQLGDRYDEASGATVAQVELNKKRECEIIKLRKDVEEANIASESVLTNLKRKQGDSVLEMQEQTDALQKMKAKIDKDKQIIMAEIADARAATDEVGRSQASADKSNKNLLETLNAINKKLDAANLTIGDFAMMKNKIANENGELLRIVGDLENSLNMLAKAKSALGSQLNDVKAHCDNEARDRQLLLGKYRNLEHEVDVAKEALDEEAAGRENILRLNAKAEGDAAAMRQKYEQDAVAKAEELEMTKMKLAARNTEAEATIDNLNAKLAQVEKAKSKIQQEINEMTTNLDQAQVVNAAMERKAKQFDKTISEYKGKVDRLSFDLDVSQKETRNASSELFKVKSAYEETVLQLEEVRRENKTLSNEIKDIMDQITEGGRNIHEIDKIRKRLESEKMELEAALSEAEGALEQEENKVLRSQLELSQVRQEIERRIAEKEEEFASTRKNFGKAIEGMQAAIETESKAKAEALRMKKKLETDVLDLDTSLEHANAANAETQKNIKKYHDSLRLAQAKLEDEQRAKEVAHDNLIAADRKAHANQNALEEARTLLEQADRSRRIVEQELSDANETP